MPLLLLLEFPSFGLGCGEKNSFFSGFFEELDVDVPLMVRKFSSKLRSLFLGSLSLARCSCRNSKYPTFRLASASTALSFDSSSASHVAPLSTIASQAYLPEIVSASPPDSTTGLSS